MEQAALPGGWSSLLNADNYVIGVEIGGRGQRVVVANAAGQLLGDAHAIDRALPAASVLETINALVEQACQSAGVPLERIVRVGVAFGGPVDPKRGLTLLSHRVTGFEDFPLVNLIEDHLGIPTVLENDARAAALGEAMFGAARGSSDVVYVHLGTGVGGGILVDGRLLHGSSSTTGEIGHMVVSVNGPICSCGKPGHLEAYAAAPSILARFRERLRAALPEEIEEWCDPNAITVRMIFERARRGGVAGEVVFETVQVLGLAIANLITVLNPEAVIVGGSVAEVGPLLMNPLAARVRQYAYPASVRRMRVSAAQFRGDVTILGAVALAVASLVD